MPEADIQKVNSYKEKHGMGKIIGMTIFQGFFNVSGNGGSSGIVKANYKKAMDIGETYDLSVIDTLGSGLSMSGNELSATGTGDMSNPMTAKGDIIVGGTSGTPTKLAKGTSGQVLMMNTAGTTPEWKTPSTISDTWRPVQVNGSEILGSSTSSSVLNFR